MGNILIAENCQRGKAYASDLTNSLPLSKEKKPKTYVKHGRDQMFCLHIRQISLNVGLSHPLEFPSHQATKPVSLHPLC